MPRKFDPSMLDHRIIRRAMHNADSFETCLLELTATWLDPLTKKAVDFTGTIQGEITLKTARIHGEEEVYDLKKVLTAIELRAFNFLISVELSARLRNAA